MVDRARIEKGLQRLAIRLDHARRVDRRVRRMAPEGQASGATPTHVAVASRGQDVAGPDDANGARRPPPGGVGSARWVVLTAAIPWFVSRILVAAAFVIAHQRAVTGHLSPDAAARVRDGLLGWDAGWYESIARHGYSGAGHASLRFFPLVPLLARGLSVLPGLGVGAALVVVSNLCALAATMWLVVLVREEKGDASLARRAAWFVSLAPPAFTLVMGYAEGTLLLLSVGTFWALRKRKWWLAAALGFLAGLCRPIGVLLVLPALVEAARGFRSQAPRELFRRGAAVVGPAVGFGAFLGWVGWRYGDALAPLKIQEEGGHRGAFADPFRTLAHDASYLAHGHHIGSALHVPWVLVALALLAVSLRYWPLSYGVFAGAVLVAALTTSNLDGFERYALSAFPLVLALASLARREWSERAILVASGAALTAYAVLAFTNVYVP